MNIEHYDCACSSPDHSIRFVYFEEDKGSDADMYLEVQLVPVNNWYQRVWKALKYIFGCECKYGHWDTWVLDHKDIDRLISMLVKHRARIKENKKLDVISV